MSNLPPVSLHYIKRSNRTLFKSLELNPKLALTKLQNYVPLYSHFFGLTSTNYNSINLNNLQFITDLASNVESLKTNVHICKIQEGPHITNRSVFFKMAPLIEPCLYLAGKYRSDKSLMNLPQHSSYYSPKNVPILGKGCKKMMDVHNASYIDSFFSYLSDSLIDKHNFFHGVRFYGSFLSIQKNFKFDATDDFEYLCGSKYFANGNNVMYTIADEHNIFETKTPLTIDYNATAVMQEAENIESHDAIFNMPTTSTNNVDINMDCLQKVYVAESDDNNSSNYASDSSLSSSSYSFSSSTFSSNSEIKSDSESEDDLESENSGDNNSDDFDSYSNCSSEIPNVEINILQFPVQVIAQECCDNTFDDLINSKHLTPMEWYSAFMQIIMILLTYQKMFNFTHNDLHTNNIMYLQTTKKYIYYCYQKKYYKVPTFGRLYKIIDFGRSIYTVNGHIMCSDSFKKNGDACTQYNTEPFFNPNKPRIDPNYGFDLCRMACSIIDLVLDDLNDIPKLKKTGDDAVVRLIMDWCKDDNKKCMRFKPSGSERYPGFKLYEMISKTSTQHTPENQLQRTEFRQFLIPKSNANVPENMINLDTFGFANEK
jgi:hypothetical protein